MNTREMTIENLQDGVIIQRLESALSQVLFNIADLNTDNGAREINLKIKIKPDETREIADVIIQCKTKLMEATISEVISLDRDHIGRPVAYAVMKQDGLPFASSDGPKAQDAALNN